MLDEEATRDQDPTATVALRAWRQVPPAIDGQIIRAKKAGDIQQFDMEGLTKVTREHDPQTAVLYPDWLKARLAVFSTRAP